MENRTTVFYVDDNPKSSRLLASVLEQSGFSVVAAHDPVEALARCRETPFDVALLDYDMPHHYRLRARPGNQVSPARRSRGPDLRPHRSPPSELHCVDAHFGFGTALDDLLWTMRILVRASLPVMGPRS